MSKTPYVEAFLSTLFPPERILRTEEFRVAMDDLAHKKCVNMGVVRDPVVEQLIDERRAALGLPPREWPPLDTEPGSGQPG